MKYTHMAMIFLAVFNIYIMHKKNLLMPFLKRAHIHDLVIDTKKLVKYVFDPCDESCGEAHKSEKGKSLKDQDSRESAQGTGLDQELVNLEKKKNLQIIEIDPELTKEQVERLIQEQYRAKVVKDEEFSSKAGNPLPDSPIPHNGVPENRRPQNGPRQKAPQQNGPRQNGPRQNGPRQNGPRQNAPRYDAPRYDAPRHNALNGNSEDDYLIFEEKEERKFFVKEKKYFDESVEKMMKQEGKTPEVQVSEIVPMTGRHPAPKISRTVNPEWYGREIMEVYDELADEQVWNFPENHDTEGFYDHPGFAQ